MSYQSGSFPGPRTSPTVKSLPQSNQRNLRNWQISLGAFQVALLLGIVTGCMACAFYLGFFSGQKVGIEIALSNNISNALRLPISSDDDSNSNLADAGSEEGLSDVYAKLNALDNSNDTVGNERGRGAHARAGLDTAGVESAKAKPIPQLGAIQTTEQAPVRDLLGDKEDTASVKDATENAPDVAAIKRALDNSATQGAQALTIPNEGSAGSARAGINPPQVRVLGETEEKPTLGSLAETAKESATKLKASESASVPTTNSSATIQAKEVIKEAKTNSAPVASATTIKAAESNNKEKETAKKKVEDNKKQESLVKDVLPRGWFAQVGAPDQRDDAEGLARKLKSAGFPVMIENAKVRGQQYFRVLVGPETTRQQAERLIGQLKREPGVKGDPFIRMVR